MTDEIKSLCKKYEMTGTLTEEEIKTIEETSRFFGGEIFFSSKGREARQLSQKMIKVTDLLFRLGEAGFRGNVSDELLTELRSLVPDLILSLRVMASTVNEIDYYQKNSQH